MYFDAHTHLNSDQLYPTRGQYLKDFVAVGGAGLICVGVDSTWNARTVEIATQAPGIGGDGCIVKATVGLHPSEVSYGHLSTSAQVDAAVGELETLYAAYSDQIVGIGECGFDAHYPDFATHEKLQRYLFHTQAELANKYNLPLIIHSRDAFGPTIEVLKSFPDLKIYFHCRGYGPEEIHILLKDIGKLWVGFCGNSTYPKAEPLRQSCKLLVQHPRFSEGTLGVLCETDAPWLAPQSLRGQENRPAYIREVYAGVCDFLGQDISEQIERSWYKLFLPGVTR